MKQHAKGKILYVSWLVMIIAIAYLAA